MEHTFHLGHQMQVTLHIPSTSARPRSCELWIVSVDEAAYVRALSGVRSAWYRQATADGAQLWCEEGIVDVCFEPVKDSAVLERIDAAYREKYGLGWPGPVEFITAPQARAGTLRVAAVPGAARPPAPGAR
ncbi:DUF2255 family protein [Streptomyces sp. NPDC001675]